MKGRIFQPKTMRGRVMTRQTSCGCGMGSVLLNGSAGSAATYTSHAPSPITTTRGEGLGSRIGAKLDKLVVQSKKKPENIKFSF